MKKKIIIGILTLILLFTLFSCGSKESETSVTETAISTAVSAGIGALTELLEGGQ